MKKQLLFLLGFIISISVLADVPQGISHQAVIRDLENNLIVESPIGLKVSILQGAHDGDAVYVETHNVLTNKNGLISYVIGNGSVVEGVFQDIDWADGPYWLETKADPDGGTNYSISGVTMFLSVPYSLYSGTAKVAESFITKPPKVIVTEATDIGEFSATMNSLVNGEGFLTNVVFEWGTTPSYGNTVTAIPSPVTGSDDVHVSAFLSNLQAATTYHYRIKASNAVDIIYSEDMSFTTGTSVPQLTTNPITSITPFSANSGGNITYDGGLLVNERGVVWSTESNPTLDNHEGITNDGEGDGSFISELTELLPGTFFYVKAYATNDIGTAYGNQHTFTTLGQIPTVLTQQATEVTPESAVLNASVIPNHLETTVIFEWGLTEEYGNEVVAEQSPIEGGTNISVSALIDGLEPGTTYHFRVVAENELGVSIGNNMTFSTLSKVMFNVNNQGGNPVANAKITVYSLDKQSNSWREHTKLRQSSNLTNEGYDINNRELPVFEVSNNTKPGTTPSYDSDRDDGEWIKYWQSSINDNALGLASQENWYAAIRWMPEDLVAFEGFAVTRIRVYMNDAPNHASAMIWQGDIDNPTVKVQQSMGVTSYNWVQVQLSDLYMIDTSQELWIGWEVGDPGDGFFPAAFETSTAHDQKANLLQFGDNPWNFASAFGFETVWNIEAYVIPIDTDPQIIFTDANGQASFNADDGDYYYVIQKEGHTSTSGYFTVEGENVTIDVTLFDEEIGEDQYTLSLFAIPENAGVVTGAGEYLLGEEVSINATANSGWEFINWTGDTEYLDDADSAEAIVTMPADDVTLTAVFQEDDDPDIIYGDGVTDIDGNDYITVIIGNQEWMAKNLRVTKYNNGDAIPTGLSNADWGSTTSGAYAIYPHEGGASEDDVEGINSDEEMVAAYGKLYNWFAVDDTRGLCPEGWYVPSHDDWTQLERYICNSLGNSDCETHFPYNNTTMGWKGTNEGNALKSCRQVGSPLEGCNTSDHPRWNWHSTHYGFDEFGFSALPGGHRRANGVYYDIVSYGYWWSSSEYSSPVAWYRLVDSGRGNVGRGSFNKRLGFSVRCLKDDSEETTQGLIILDENDNDITFGYHVVRDSADEFTIEANVFFLNDTDGYFEVLVRKIEMDILEETMNTFVWNGTLYPPFIDEVPENSLIVLAPGETSTDMCFYGEYTPNGQSGFSIIEYEFFSAGTCFETVKTTVIYATNGIPYLTFHPGDGAENVAVDSSFLIISDISVSHEDGTEITGESLQDLINLRLHDSSGQDVSFDALINEDKTEITITPLEDLASSTSYFLEVLPLMGFEGEINDGQSVSFTTE